MGGKQIWGVAIRTVISIAILGGAVMGFKKLGAGTPPTRQKPERSDKPLVEVVKPRLHDGPLDFEVDGSVVATRNVNVAAQVAGEVTFKAEHCEVGRPVQKGEVLFRIDTRDYQLEIDRLNEELKQAKNTLIELDVEEASVRNAISLANEELVIRQGELKRYLEITDPGVFSKTELDAAKRNELAARLSLQTQNDQLRLIQSRKLRLASARDLVSRRISQADLDLTRTTVTSPVNGIVITANVEQGGYLQKGGAAVSIQDTETMEVECDLFMQQLKWLWQTDDDDASKASVKAAKQGKQSDDGESGSEPAAVEETADAFDFPRKAVTVIYTIDDSQYAWQGRLDRFGSAGVDRKTRMVPCVVKVPLPKQVLSADRQPTTDKSAPRSLMSGMFVKVRVHTEPKSPLLVIPDAAVRPGNVVWAVRDNKLHKAQVDIVHSNRESVFVLEEGSGLTADDSIVISPLTAPASGAEVRLLGE